MDDIQRQARIEYLKKFKLELESLGREEFLKIVANKYSQQWADFVLSMGFDDWARGILNQQVTKELEELEG